MTEKVTSAVNAARNGPEDERPVDGLGRLEALLVQELQEVRDRLHEPAKAGAVRSVAQLHPSHDLALCQREVGERRHDEVDHDERLDQADVPLDLGRHALITSTDGWRSPACSSATRATPSIRLRFTRARSSTEVPFDWTSTASPVAIPRESASARESSTSRSGRWKPSAATRSTAGPEKRGR